VDGAQDPRQAGRVGHRQVGEIAGPEPAEIVVLLGCGVDRIPFPTGDDERVHVEGGVTDGHRDGYGVVDVDAEFLEAFSTDRLVWQLARLDMSADEVPAVGIPPTRRMAMHQEHETVAHKCSDGDRNLGDHGRHTRRERSLGAAERA